MKPTLLHDWLGEQIDGWLMSEKLDGWRLIWDGTNYLTRQGNVLDAPQSWYIGMPDTPLDGELFAGRGQFNSIQKRMAGGWSWLRFHVFDTMHGKASDRINTLREMDLPKHCTKVDHRVVRSIDDMMEFAQHIINLGGEGVVVRNPQSEYIAGRSHDILRWVPQDPAINRR